MTDEAAAPGPDPNDAQDRGARSVASPVDAVAEAVGHLQTAALSMVAAVRAALDAAEQVAKDPGPLLSLLSDAARQSTAGAEPGPGEASAQRPRVEHIAVTPKQGPASDDRAGGVSRTGAERDEKPSDERDPG